MLQKMKHNLDILGEAILLFNYVLKSDKPMFSRIINGVMTFTFLLVWLLPRLFVSKKQKSAKVLHSLDLFLRILTWK